MITDKFENKNHYVTLHKGFEKAFEFIMKCASKKMEDGRYEIDGDKIYANVQTYPTKSEAEFEAHRRYIDIQYIISGSELIEWSPMDELKERNVYNAEKDIVFFENANCASSILMNKGSFAIFFPDDAHKPCLNTSCENTVQKVVLKVSL